MSGNFTRKSFHLPAAVHVRNAGHVCWKRHIVAVIQNVFTIFADTAPSRPFTQNCKSNKKCLSNIVTS